jgi:hypothetical protein
MLRFSCNFASTIAHYTYPNFLNKNINLSQMQVPNYYGYPFSFCKCNDGTTPSNPLVVPMEDEKLEETPFNVNVS